MEIARERPRKYHARYVAWVSGRQPPGNRQTSLPKLVDLCGILLKTRVQFSSAPPHCLGCIQNSQILYTYTVVIFVENVYTIDKPLFAKLPCFCDLCCPVFNYESAEAPEIVDEDTYSLIAVEEFATD